MLLADGCSDFPWRCADDPRRLARERVCAVRAACPVDRILEAAGNRPVVFGRDEQHGVDGSNRILEGSRNRWKVCVVVIAVQWEIAERDLSQLQLFRGKAYQRP